MCARSIFSETNRLQTYRDALGDTEVRVFVPAAPRLSTFSTATRRTPPFGSGAKAHGKGSLASAQVCPIICRPELADVPTPRSTQLCPETTFGIRVGANNYGSEASYCGCSGRPAASIRLFPFASVGQFAPSGKRRRGRRSNPKGDTSSKAEAKNDDLHIVGGYSA